MRTLADRLSDVRAGTARRPARQPTREARDLCRSVGGVLVERASGQVAIVERAVDIPPSVRAHLDTGSPPRYFDTETTGLSTGSGTVIFMAAVGRLVGDRLVVAQYLLPDYEHEAALLEMVIADLAAGQRLVSFNGRAFDLPMLTGRLAFHGLGPISPPLPERHDDLLPAARRLWARSIGSVRLAELERRVLRVRRAADCPSWEVPGRYFAYLRGGPPAILREVIDHNAQDVASLVLLEAELGRLRSGGWREAPLVDPHGMALELVRAGAIGDALDLVDLAVVGAADGSEASRLRRLAGRLLVASGQLDRAEALWRSGTGRASVDAAASWIEIARLRERHAGDLVGAVEAARAASRILDLALALGRGGGIAEIGRVRLLVEGRRRRLARRVAAAARRANGRARQVA